MKARVVQGKPYIITRNGNLIDFKLAIELYNEIKNT
jgi:hypothetical protein